jgi:hypothetical protein
LLKLPDGQARHVLTPVVVGVRVGVVVGACLVVVVVRGMVVVTRGVVVVIRGVVVVVLGAVVVVVLEDDVDDTKLLVGGGDGVLTSYAS